MKYIVLSSNVQSNSATPVLRVEASGWDSAPTSVLPYDGKNPQQVVLASRLLESIQDHPDDNTLARIAVSFGGVTGENGEEIE